MSSYKINKDYVLSGSAGSSDKAKGGIIILHEIGVNDSSAKNNAQFEQRTWENAYVTHIVGDGIVYLVGTPGYVSWGAGSQANAYAVAQIEMERSSDKAKALRIYATYVSLARDLAKQFNVPLTLDAGTSLSTKGFKSHAWVTAHIWGDHEDPYGYLKTLNISKDKLANDLKNGVGSAPSKPSKPSTGGNNNNGGGGVKYGGASVSDAVKVASFATNFATGEKMDSSVRGGTYTVLQEMRKPQSKSTYRYLIGKGKTPTGWVLGQDISVVKGSSKPNTGGSSKPNNGGWIAQGGTFYPNTTIALRTGASTGSSLIANIGSGQSIQYNAFGYFGGYVWLRQKRGSGYGYLASGEAKGTTRTSYWGRFE